MKDPDDITIYRKSIERTQVHIFLSGLYKSFDKLRQEIFDLLPLMRILRNIKLLLWFLAIDLVIRLKIGLEPPIQRTLIVQTNLNALTAIKQGIQKVIASNLLDI